MLLKFSVYVRLKYIPFTRAVVFGFNNVFITCVNSCINILKFFIEILLFFIGMSIVCPTIFQFLPYRKLEFPTSSFLFFEDIGLICITFFSGKTSSIAF